MAVFASQERAERGWRALLGRVGLRVEYLMRYRRKRVMGLFWRDESMKIEQ